MVGQLANKKMMVVIIPSQSSWSSQESRGRGGECDVECGVECVILCDDVW